MLEHNIEQNVKEASKRKVYGQTMYGVRSSIRIEDWIIEHIEELKSHDEQEELLKTIWPILSENIHNNTFKKFTPSEILFDIVLEWINGQTYEALLDVASEEDCRIIAGKQKRRITMDAIIEICDNGFSYDGTLAIGAIVEILKLLYPDDSDEVIIKLLELQKRLKYGLSNPLGFTVYELGFSDRVIAKDIAYIIKDTSIDIESIINSIKRNESKVRVLLEKYPSYYMERFINLLRP